MNEHTTQPAATAARRLELLRELRQEEQLADAGSLVSRQRHINRAGRRAQAHNRQVTR